MKITDLHMHVVPGVDDGSFDMRMSLDMLELAYEQGVRDIFCTSHNVYSEEEITKYKSQFMMLQMMARARFADLNLHMGCELLCAGEYIDDILYGLEIGVFLPLGNSKSVLTELYPDVTPKEAKSVVEAMVAAGWKPILAHAERYPALFDGTTLQDLIDLGAKIQVNLYSLVEENKDDIRERARHLADKCLAHFVGSDAHRINYRSPKYESGVRYIEEHCGNEYLAEVCYKNSDSFIFGKTADFSI